MRYGSPSIGVLSPLLAGAYFGEVIKGISRHVATLGGRVVAVQTLDAELGDHYPDVPPFRMPVSWERVDGFVVVISAAPEPFLRLLAEQGKPVVLVSHDLPGYEAPRVMPDNASGIEEAVAHLVGHGHRRIAFAGDVKLPDIAERHQAYVASMASHGLAATDDLFFNAPNCCEDGGEEAAEAMAAAGYDFTAVVAATDLNAMGIMRRAQAAGLDVPRRLAIVGFDDMDFAGQLSPPLASVRQNFAGLSDLAARLIVDMVQGRPVVNGEHRVRTTFVPRASCGCQRSFRSPMPARPNEAADDRLRANLVEALCDPQAVEAHSDLVSLAAAEIASMFRRGLEGQETDRAPVVNVSEQLHRAFPRRETAQAVTECLQQYRRDLLHDHYSDERLKALDRCTSAVVHSLTNSEVGNLAKANESLQSSLRAEYFVSMGLVGLRIGQLGLRSEGMRPKSLDWLANTRARAACLALWDRNGRLDQLASQPLRVAGVYGPGLAERLPVGTTLEIRSFPPVDVLTELGSSAEDVVFVLPVRTATRFWGILAVVGPSEAVAITGRDIYFQWAALLGIALDHEALIESLKEQREDLADAYHRERELVEEIRASEERYVLAASATNDALWDWDAARGTFFYSPRWKALLGYRDDEIGTSESEWLDRVHPDDMPAVQAVLDRTVRSTGAFLESEHRVLARDGTYRWVCCRAAILRGPDGKAVRLVGSMTDVTERKELEDRLRQAALHDSLTGLANRSLFNDRLTHAIARAKRGPSYQFCVVFLDLDGFKVVNDRFGHVTGDALLVAVAERIRGHLRENDTAVRFGGDEFALLLDDVGDLKGTRVVVDRLMEQLSAPYSLDGQQVEISATAGIALSSSGYDNPEDMVRDADSAMYEAKRRRGPVA